ncbi:MAG TPA: hypothetical protein VHO70_00680, partial [Chitinispirillaceae bacterium]|nr:hypothetical protein [Chitinispirillaceae bacterium]
NDSIASSTIQYSIISPDQLTATGPHYLASIHYTAQISKRTYSSVNIQVTPDTLTETTTAIPKAKLYIVVDYGKGSGGVFEGVLDYQAKKVHGIYSENGTEFDFLFETSSNESTFHKK